MPSRQRAEACRLAFARAARARGERVWDTPDIVSVDAWLAREINARARHEPLPRLLSTAQDWLLWRQGTAEFTAQLELVARGALAEGLRRADQLGSDYLIAPSADAGAEAALLHDVQAAVRARYAALDVTNAHLLASQLPGLGAERPVEFAGYASLPPGLRGIAAARRVRGFATQVRAAASPARRAHVVTAADPDEELERIAAWAVDLLARRMDARLLIVLPGAAGTRDRLATLLRQALAPRTFALGAEAARTALVAIEGGEPLARAPLVAHALATLAILARSLDFESLSAWLCAPYWREPDGTARARVDLLLRRAQELELDLPRLLALLAHPPASREATPPLARALAVQLSAAAVALQGPSAAPRDWAVRIRAALEAVHFPGARTLTSEDEQTFARFNELLNEFGELGVAARSMTRTQALQTFEDLARRSAFRPASGDAPITVTPRLEDPLIHYDGIWVAGLDATAWPEPIGINPFLPASAQRAADIPAASAAGRTAQARALMLAWRAAATDLVFSSATRAEDLERAPSPLLAEWQREEATHAPAPMLWLPTRLRRAGMLETLVDAVAPAWPSSVPLPSGTRVLELQNLCAFRAFAELRLGCAPLDTPAPGVTPQERGQLIHAALEELWKVLQDSHALQARSKADLDALIDVSVARAAQARWGDVRTPAQRRERRRAARLIATLCELERGREHFSVRELEFEASVLLGGGQLRLRIDRIDALAAGGVAILDYKSGAHRSMDWYGEHLSHPQLLAYLAAIGTDVRALATVNIAARDVRFAGIGATPDLLPRVDTARVPAQAAGGDPWSASSALWRERIETLARDFVAGRAAVAPAPRACDYCEVTSLCRIADYQLKPDIDEAPDD